MKLLYFGDVVGKAGRRAMLSHLPLLTEKFAPDFVMANGENAAHGFGITAKICTSFFEAGIDDHAGQSRLGSAGDHNLYSGRATFNPAIELS